MEVASASEEEAQELALVEASLEEAVELAEAVVEADCSVAEARAPAVAEASSVAAIGKFPVTVLSERTTAADGATMPEQRAWEQAQAWPWDTERGSMEVEVASSLVAVIVAAACPTQCSREVATDRTHVVTLSRT